MEHPSSFTGYSTRDVAALLGLSASQVRAYVRAGFLAPERGARGELRFTFQDLVLLRTAKALVAARVPARRIRMALQKLRQQLPQGRSLSGVRISADGAHLVVRDGAEVWDPESGQSLLDFDVGELARDAAPLARRAVDEAERRHGEEELSADAWYALGYDLETTSAEAACAAYERALALDPELPDAHLNLGRLLHEAGDLAAAEHHYRDALALRPGDATAAFNLGVALEDAGRLPEASDAYELAIAADPRAADAHHNLAWVYERLGEPQAALRHWKAYKSLRENGR